MTKLGWWHEADRQARHLEQYLERIEQAKRRIASAQREIAEQQRDMGGAFWDGAVRRDR